MEGFCFFLHMHKSHGSATAINLSMLFNNEPSMFKRLHILSLFHTTISYHLVLVSSCRLHILVFLFNPYPQFYHLPHLHHHHHLLFNSTLCNMLGTLSDEEKSDWKSHLGCMTHAYNCTKHASTTYSPYYLMFGRHPRLPIDVAFGLHKPNSEVTGTFRN